jgi:hypothetical protein
MAFPLSPAVTFTEYDLGTVVPPVSMYSAATVGEYHWGPCFYRKLVTNESDLRKLFGNPQEGPEVDWWMARNFLDYGDSLWVVRAANHTSNNTLNTGTVTIHAPSRTVTGHSTKFDVEVDVGNLINIGNYSYKVATVVDNTHITISQNPTVTVSANGITKTLHGSVAIVEDSNVVTGYNTLFTRDLANGDTMIVDNAEYVVTVANNTHLTIVPDAATTLSRVAAKLKMSGTVDTDAGSQNVVGIGTIFTQELIVGDYITSNDDANFYRVESIANDDHLVVATTPIVSATTSNYYKVNNLRAKNATAANSVGFYVDNNDTYTHNYKDGSLDTLFGCGDWIAKYPGALGNSLKISVCSSANAYQSNVSGRVTINAGSTQVGGEGTAFNSEVVVGDLLIVNRETHPVLSIESDTALTLASHHIQGAESNTAVRRWQYSNKVTFVPVTTDYANKHQAYYDEMHIAIVDEFGHWTGTDGTVLDVFQGVSMAADAKFENGSTAYYVDVIDQRCEYVRWAAHNFDFSNAGLNIVGANTKMFGGANLPLTYHLVGGNDGTTIDDQQRMEGFDLFVDKESSDITYLIGGAADQTLATYLINDVAEVRKDCVALLSPPRECVIDNYLYEAEDTVAYRGLLPSSSYYFLTCNWKYQYDKFRDIYVWVPDCADMAGLAVQTATERNPWWSFAGLNRGHVKNVIKLAWNPNKAQRDLLYQNAINPVYVKRNQGAVLMGDKTGLMKPSSFDRINVRMLFIYMEKGISIAAEYGLFELNDMFTRAAFRNMVEPYLDNIKGGRGIYAYKVVCDESNNPGYVIDNHQFICDIYVQPEKSINWIQLNFVAIPTGVEFNLYTLANQLSS